MGAWSGWVGIGLMLPLAHHQLMPLLLFAKVVHSIL
jgi:hypothetical protein